MIFSTIVFTGNVTWEH